MHLILTTKRGVGDTVHHHVNCLNQTPAVEYHASLKARPAWTEFANAALLAHVSTNNLEAIVIQLKANVSVQLSQMLVKRVKYATADYAFVVQEVTHAAPKTINAMLEKATATMMQNASRD